jgi:hypothetical protein
MARKPADLRASGGEDAGAAWSLSPVAARETMRDQSSLTQQIRWRG